MMRLLISIFLLVLAGNLQARVNFIEVEDLNTWEKMFKLAKQQNLDVLVYVDYMSCADCKKLQKETFRDNDLEAFIKQNTLPLQISAVSIAGEALEKVYGYGNVPTIFYLNVREELFYKKTGFISAENLLQKLKKAKSASANYQTWLAKARKNELNLDGWLTLLEIDEMNGRVDPSNDVIERVSLLLDSANFNDKRVLRFVENLCVDVDGAVFQTLVEHPNWISDTVTFNWEAYQQNVFNFNVNKAIVKVDSVLLEDVLFQINRLTITKGIPNLKFKGRQLYLAELNKWDQYDTLTKTYLDTLPIDSVDTYEIEAAHIMEFYASNEKAMNVALGFLRTGLAKKETYQLYYGLCLWLYYQYDYVNAYKAGYRAYEMAETDEERLLARQLMTAIENEY